MYEIAGLDSQSIFNKVEETLNSNIILAKNKILINHTVLYASKDDLIKRNSTLLLQ